MTWKFLILTTMTTGLLPAAGADSERGARLFETLSCAQCHSINGKGGTTAPDLGRRIDRNFTPASLAATMWNHAPAMWASMRERNLPPGNLNEQAAADLFAFFYSVRFFDKPGDAGRGKRLFTSRHCADCHGVIAQAKPVAQWETAGHPIALATAMWNHAATMRDEFAKRRLAWPELTSQDLSDLLVYVRNLPRALQRTSRLEITSGAGGRELFVSKGCGNCHKGHLDLAPRLRNKTLTGIAVDMWNHAPRMPTTPASLDLEQMTELLSYLWAEQFFRDSGDPAAGARLFASKRCITCHKDALGGPFTSATMVSALWLHGPEMLQRMKASGVAWPRVDGREMSNLIAHINSKRPAK